MSNVNELFKTEMRGSKHSKSKSNILRKPKNSESQSRFMFFSMETIGNLESDRTEKHLYDSVAKQSVNEKLQNIIEYSSTQRSSDGREGVTQQIFISL